MTANDILVGTKLTEPIGSLKSENKIPSWAEAGRIHISRPEPGVKVIQWIRDAVDNVYTRIPFNKIRKNPFFGFTCTACPRRGNKLMWDMRAEKLGGDGTSVFLSEGTRIKQALPIRCRECNTKHARYKRARRGMEKITRELQTRPGLKAWFVTLTKPNRIFEPGETVDLTGDKEQWIQEFRKFRQRTIWKETFSGGYWFYEYTVHAPGDKIFDKRGCFVRECKSFELNGHLHILTTAESKIPMRELAADWDGRIDFRYRDKKTNQKIDESTIMRYLRGYLTKSTSSGVNMRPFGDIHRTNTSNEHIS